MQNMAFNPVTGLRDKGIYQTVPASEDALRDQVQTGMDQLRDYINAYLVSISNVVAKNATGNLATSEIGTVEATTGAGGIALTLPSALIVGLRYTIKKVDNGVGVLTINTTGGQMIEGVTSKTLSRQYDYITVISNGASWDILGECSLASVSAFRAYQSVSQAIPATTFTKLQFQTEQYDNLGEYDPVLYRFTASKAGIYLVTSGVSSVQTAGNRATLTIYKNGFEIAKIFDYTIGGTGSPTGKLAGAEQVFLAATDYIEMFMWTQNALAIDMNSINTFFTVTRIA